MAVSSMAVEFVAKVRGISSCRQHNIRADPSPSGDPIPSLSRDPSTSPNLSPFATLALSPFTAPPRPLTNSRQPLRRPHPDLSCEPGDSRNPTRSPPAQRSDGACLKIPTSAKTRWRSGRYDGDASNPTNVMALRRRRLSCGGST